MKARILLAVLGLAGPALADVPPPDYFTGVYERVGRAAGDAPAAVNDLVRITPDGKGGLVVAPCAAGGQDPLLDRKLSLGFSSFDDVSNLLSTPEGDPWLACQFFNDMDNYPIIACHGDKGMLITLWPANQRAGECPS